MKVLLLIRKRAIPGTAIHNATRYDAAYLDGQGIEAHVQVIDTSVKAQSIALADVIIVEGAGWMPIDALKALSSRVLVRVHAAPEFLYYEYPDTCASGYLNRCLAEGIGVGFVAEELVSIFKGSRALGITYKLPFTRCLYEYEMDKSRPLHVGCFGALRPLKNHIGQFLAVAKFSAQTGRECVFHIISSRAEEQGGRILAELRALSITHGVTLVGHTWEAPGEFSKLVDSMDVGMCASLAESFCLTAADFVAAGKPCILSQHIPWAPSPADAASTARPGVHGIAKALESAVGPLGIWWANRNQRALDSAMHYARVQWRSFLGEAI